MRLEEKGHGNFFVFGKRLTEDVDASLLLEVRVNVHLEEVRIIPTSGTAF